MKHLQPFIIAFSMYSTLPMPRLDWDKKSMRLALCYFPFVGVVLGGGLFLWDWAAKSLSFGPLLFAGGALVLTMGITGGIHMDGFCDTVDALASRQPKERKLEILKDPHVGSFAILGCVLYCLSAFALWAEIQRDFQGLMVLALGFVLSRTLSGLCAVTFRSAKKGGTLAAFTEHSKSRGVKVYFAVLSVLLIGMMVWVYPLAGTAAAAGAVFSLTFYRWMSYRQFGGTTGDLAGFFLTICEMAFLAAVVLVQKFVG